MRTLMVSMMLALTAPAAAGNGFEGVGGRGKVPAFSDPSVLDDEQELLDILEQHDAEQHARLLRLREVDRAAYMIALARVAQVVERAQDDPVFRERLLAIQTKTQRLRDLAREYRSVAATEQVTRRAEMETLAGEVLDLKQEDRRVRLEELRARLEQLQAEFDERSRNRERVVDEYVDQLLKEPVDL